MEFNDFLDYIPKITKVTLPSESAHLKMAPPERKDLLKNLNIDALNPREAAVLMLVYPLNGLATLALIKRNSYKGVHSSQVAFPGGKVESFDASILETALRETQEEIGIHKNDISIICPFSEIYIPPSNFRVAPFLGYCRHTPIFTPDPREVAEMIAFPLNEFLDDKNLVMNKMATSYSDSIDVPAFKTGENMIWGATAMMLNELKEVLKAVL